VTIITRSNKGGFPNPPQIHVSPGPPKSIPDGLHKTRLPHHSGAEYDYPTLGLHQADQLGQLTGPPEETASRLFGSQIEKCHIMTHKCLWGVSKHLAFWTVTGINSKSDTNSV
jgi:hypothetical protein